MKIHQKLQALFVFLLLLSSCSEKQGDSAFELGEFGAFYTRMDSNEPFEKYARVREHADIVVDLGKDGATFNFWRGSSYLPYLETPNGKWYVDEIVPRSGDGTDFMPDRTNAYSVVKLIKSSENEVVVHWRYLPQFLGGNPQQGVAAQNFVDEYFFINKDGSVKRTIQKGTPRIDAWRNSEKLQVQTFSLTKKGITSAELTNIAYPSEVIAVSGTPIIEPSTKPVAWWKFDEAKGDMASETISNTASEVKGNKTLWRKGVSGTALQLDGYFSEISLPADKAPKPVDAITLESWVAIGAYPWSFVPIVQQSDDNPEILIAKKGGEAFLHGEEGREQFEASLEDEDEAFDFVLQEEDDTGYFLGLDGYGNPSFKIRTGGKWEQLATDFHLERRTWYHITATYDRYTGYMKVYVNGKQVGSKKVTKAAPIELADRDVRIGKGKNRRPIRPVRDNTFSDTYSLDGLIDEIKIYDTALSQSQISATYNAYKDNFNAIAEVDMDKRILPAGENRKEFGAYYTHLKFYDVWDNLWRFGDHPDVVVEFDANPSKFIFWRGTGYIPMMANEKGQWYSNEFNETWNKSGGEGCMEPMSDKEAFTNHARIIENTPARVVIHWRYPLLDVNRVMANYNNETGWCDWSDWYFYIYPDGIAVKDMLLWTDGERNHEWQESMAIFGPDQHPEEIINTKGALTMLNLDGEMATYDWVGSPPKDLSQPAGQSIQYINYTGEYKPITVGDFTESDVYSGELTSYAAFPTWNHWPVSQMPSDGRYAIYPDRTAHSSLTHVPPSVYEEDFDGSTPFYKKLLMEGMLDIRPEDVVPVARSWMRAPEIIDLTGATGKYDRAQRAYKLEREGDEIIFRINASPKQPVVNLAFVINQWPKSKKSNIKIDDLFIKSRQGDVRNVDGTNTRVIWLEYTAVEPIKIEIW